MMTLAYKKHNCNCKAPQVNMTPKMSCLIENKLCRTRKFRQKGKYEEVARKKLNQSQRALASLADQGCRADRLFKAMNFTRFQVSE